MNRIIKYQITTPTKNIQDFLKDLGYSHAVISHLKKTPNGILRNNIWAYTRDKLSIGDTLTICIAENSSSANIIPVNLPFTIIYEDADLMIINKPCNMPIHPSQGNHDNTLANAIAYYFQCKNEPFVYRCINRLDRDTTGLLILAKHAYSASLLSSMVGDRLIHREYLAIVSGTVTGCGVIDAPIGRLDGSTIERCIDYHTGETAITHWKQLPVAIKEGYSLVSITLETGRTHQIRVHMKHIGHPLPGDFLYHPDYSLIQRQALHSYKLNFLHPITKETMNFTCDLPEDMKQFLL
ncbi:MAG: RluA family pseudouridine synthase [Lachnospiraceae bacterium]|nr:RluA family pseudouridine synthase [Lachnospiraceae bacterium]